MSLSSGLVLNIGSQKPDVNDFDSWQQRLVNTSHHAIRDAVRNKLIEGVVLS